MLFLFISFFLFQFNTASFTFINSRLLSQEELKDISYFLESENSRLKERWSFRQGRKIEIYFCTSTNDFVSKTNAGRNAGAQFTGNRIYLQPIKLLIKRNILYDVLRHELIHSLLYYNAPINTPYWFHEAFAVFASGELDRLSKRSKIKFSTMGELAQFAKSKKYDEVQTAYYYLGLAMQYLNNEYGAETLKEIASSKNLNFDKIFPKKCGSPINTIESNLISYLKKF